MAETLSFLERVRQQLAEFHPMERQLAEFVLDFPGDLASYAANELAALSGVSNATVSRFIKRSSITRPTAPAPVPVTLATNRSRPANRCQRLSLQRLP